MPLARAIILPAESNAQLRPSKIKSSLPPTWFTYSTGNAVLLRHLPQHRFAQSLFAHGEGRRRRFTRQRAPACASTSTGSVISPPAARNRGRSTRLRKCDAQLQRRRAPDFRLAPVRNSGLRQTRRRWAAALVETRPDPPFLQQTALLYSGRPLPPDSASQRPPAAGAARATPRQAVREPPSSGPRRPAATEDPAGDTPTMLVPR